MNDPQGTSLNQVLGNGEVDLFVSYAHADDEVPSGASCGWVTTLVGELKRVLRRKLGGDGATVWMDHELAANQPLTPTLRDRVRRSRTLLIVLSPGFAKSEWCQRELADFVAAAQIRGDSDAVFAIEVEPIGRGTRESPQLPDPIRQLVPIEFWVREGDFDEPRLLGYPRPNQDEYSPYWKLVTRLAGQIRTRLQRARPPASPPKPPPGTTFDRNPAQLSAATVGLASGDIASAHGLALYLHAAPEDQPLAATIADRLDAAGIVVVYPDPAPRQTFEACLREHDEAIGACQGMLMLSDQAPTGNLMAALQLARRSFGARRSGPWSAVLHLRPGRPDLPVRNVVQVDCRDGFEIGRLEPFFAALKAEPYAQGAERRV